MMDEPEHAPFSIGGEHIEGCAQSERKPCYIGRIDRGTDDHRFSGWPGAFCLDCHAEDKDEVCLALSCRCPCHDAFYREMSEYFLSHPDG